MATRKGNAPKVSNVARIAADSTDSEASAKVDEPNDRFRRLYIKRLSGQSGRRLRALMTRRTNPNE